MIMKKILIVIAMFWGIYTSMVAQGVVTDSVAAVDDNTKKNIPKDTLFAYLDTYVSQLREPEYKLYPTDNMYTFLRLNTRTGQIKIVQWSTEQSKRFIYTLDNEIRISSWQEDICGRFILQKTDNIYNFILLDQIDGRCWQVQWNFDRDKCMVLRIW